MRVFLAGGVPEVMLHLRALGLLHGDARTILGRTWDDVLDEWEGERAARAAAGAARARPTASTPTTSSARPRARGRRA